MTKSLIQTLFLFLIPSSVICTQIEFIERPSSQNVTVGGVATFFCSAKGQPQPTLSWFKNGRKISSTRSRYTMIEADGYSILRIEPTRIGIDEASFECRAENEEGDSISSEFFLKVYEVDKAPVGFPSVDIQTNVRLVKLGHSTSLQCSVEGLEPLKVFWLKDMKRVQESTRYTFNKDSLHISQAEDSDRGRYECVVQNSIGTQHSDVMNLYVKINRSPLRISTPPNELYEINAGDNLNITCIASGAPMPSVSWEKYDDDDETSWSQNSEEVSTGKVVLQLKNVTKTEKFWCIATSSLGRDSAQAVIKVKGPGPLETSPKPSLFNLQAIDVKSRSITLTWSPSTSINFKISYEGRCDFFDNHGNLYHQTIPLKEILVSNETSLTLEKLYPFTIYSINLTEVFNDFSEGEQAKISVSTQMAAPPKILSPDFDGVVNGGQIRVTLRGSTGEFGPISHYLLIVVPENELNNDKSPDEFFTKDLIQNDDVSSPFIAAYFSKKIPSDFILGTGEVNNNFKNKKLQKDMRYRIFVRAFVKGPSENFYTSSPFSSFMSLNM